MSDQLCKVDKPAPNWCPRCHKRPDDVTFCTHEFHRIESDAAPVEVDHFAASWRGDWNSTMRGYAEEYARRANATLARQLAEAKAEIAAHERNDIAATDLIHSFLQRLEQAESALAAATRRVAEVDEVALAEVIQNHTGCGDSDSIYAAHAVIQHLQAAALPAVPSDWALVPEAATHAMILAGVAAANRMDLRPLWGDLEEVWNAMLAATPAHDQPEGEG